MESTWAGEASVTPSQLRRAAAGFFHFTAHECFIVGLVVTTVQFCTAVAYGIATETDFAIFQRTTERFLDGLRMYSAESFDFTPPLFHVLVIPLAHIDPCLAFVLWTIANVIVAWLVWRMVVEAVPGARTRRWVIAAWIVNAAGAQMTVRLGQVSWLVALLVTTAWLAARSSRWTATGIWAAIAIALKPFLLVAVPVFIVRRQWKALAACVPAIAVCCGLGLVLFGPLAFADWIGNLRATPDPAYATHFLNASWLGIVARAHAPSVVATALSVATIMLMLWRVRTSDEDETWLLLSIAALLASPVGWVYYQPMLLGPVVALAMRGRLTGIRWVGLTCVAPALSRTLFQSHAVVALTLGSVYFWGLLVAFVAIVLGPVLESAGLPRSPRIKTGWAIAAGSSYRSSPFPDESSGTSPRTAPADRPIRRPHVSG